MSAGGGRGATSSIRTMLATWEKLDIERAKPDSFPNKGEVEAPAAPATPKRPGATVENPIRVRSMAAGESLPKGTFYALPDGRIGESGGRR